MTTRLLPPEEWHRLVGTEAEALVPSLRPTHAGVVVVEDADGVIVGTWTLLRVVHAECVWVHPAHRGRGSVAARLLRGMSSLARAWGVDRVVTGACEPAVEALILKLGGQALPGRQFVVSLGGGT